MKDFGHYLLWALDGDDEECTRVACGIISDIASALQANCHIYIASFVPSLLKVLVSPQHSRESKLYALQSLSDLAIYAPVQFCQLYLNNVLQILVQASQMSL